MSVIIKGIEIPKRCNGCQFLEGDTMDGLCHAANKWLDDDDYFRWYQYEEGDIDDSKPANCPCGEMPTPQEFKEQLHDIRVRYGDDAEIAHSIMDGMMCDLLKDLGYGDAVAEFEEQDRWYA